MVFPVPILGLPGPPPPESAGPPRTRHTGAGALGLVLQNVQFAFRSGAGNFLENQVTQL